MASATPVQVARADDASITDAQVSRLRPGGYIWEPSLAPDGPMHISVNLQTQHAYVYRDGVRIGAATISSGKPGYRTPSGVFRILQKDRNHRSKKYGNLPMPFSMRVNWSGVALHAGGVPGYPSSHGCVHLPRGFARALFHETPLGTKVVMTYGAPAPADQPFGFLLTKSGSKPEDNDSGT